MPTKDRSGFCNGLLSDFFNGRTSETGAHQGERGLMEKSERRRLYEIARTIVERIDQDQLVIARELALDLAVNLELAIRGTEVGLSHIMTEGD